MVYVDDFKMSGPQGNLSKGWSLIRQGIKTDDPQPVNQCVGCEHIVRDTTVNGKPVREVEYNMRPFMEKCVKNYLDLTKTTMSDVRPAKTLSLDETKLEDDDDKPGALQAITCKVLMEIQYCARLARFDLLRAVGALATNITKWNSKCDLTLHRLVCSYVLCML
eukprot:12048938-Heterocapsa_arctica.AAC.1